MKQQILNKVLKKICFVDLETTGTFSDSGKVIEIGIVTLRDFVKLEE